MIWIVFMIIELDCEYGDDLYRAISILLCLSKLAQAVSDLMFDLDSEGNLVFTDAVFSCISRLLM